MSNNSKDDFMIKFGNMRLDTELMNAWNAFITTKLMSHPQWVQKYTWNPDCDGSGWMRVKDPDVGLDSKEGWRTLQITHRNGIKDGVYTPTRHMLLVVADSSNVPDKSVF